MRPLEKNGSITHTTHGKADVFSPVLHKQRVIGMAVMKTLAPYVTDFLAAQNPLDCVWRIK